MVPAGYLYKRVATAPDWLADPRIRDVFSVSGCISPHFCDYVGHWRHNGFWLFDRPADMDAVIASAEDGAAPSDVTLFYYEIHEREYDEELGSWRPLPDPAEPVRVERPAGVVPHGFDIVTFSQGNGPECSPLSCNRLSLEAEVNAHCLFRTFTEAEAALNAGLFANSEPGPFRIFAVHTVGEVRAGGPRSR